MILISFIYIFIHMFYLKVAAGRSHFAVVNVEKELYTWAVSLEGDKCIERRKRRSTVICVCLLC